MQAMPICLRLLRHFVWRAFPLARARAGRSSEARMAIMAMTTNSSISVKARRSAHGGGWSCIAAQSPPKRLYFVKYNEPASSGLKQRSKLGPRDFDSGTIWAVPYRPSARRAAESVSADFDESITFPQASAEETNQRV